MNERAIHPVDGPSEPSPPSAPQNLELLPEWYMPAAMEGAPLLRGWRRRVALVIVASLVLLSAFGLCSTYGRVAFG